MTRTLLAMLLFSTLPASAAAALRDCPSPGATHYYHPVGTFESHVMQTLAGPYARELMRDRRDLLDKFETEARAGLGDVLRAMGEPTLSCGEPGEQYRFLWSRSFLPYIVVRVQAVDGGWHLVAGEFATRRDGTVIPEPTRRLERTIGADEFATALAAVAAALAEPDPHEQFGFDGAHWFIEAVDADGWRMTDRFVPQDGAVRAAGLAFVRLTGWEIPADEIY